LVTARGLVKLCDFGLAKPFMAFDECEAKDLQTTDENEKAKSNTTINKDEGLCTLHYRPPEVLLGGTSEYPSIDIWSSGVVLAEFITGRPLWPGRNAIDQLSLVFATLGTPNEEIWPSVRALPDYEKLDFSFKSPKKWDCTLPRAAESPILVELLSKLLVLNPAERLTARGALNHKWLRKQATDEIPANFIYEDRIELRDELMMLASLKTSPILFPEDSALVANLSFGIADARRSVLSLLKECSICWHGPTHSPLKMCD